MLHNSGDQDVFAVTDRIDFLFFSHQVFVYNDWMLLYVTVNNRHKFADIIVIDGNLHTLSAENVGWTNKNRIAKFIGCLQCFLYRKYRMSLWSWDSALLQNLIEQFTVFCCIDIFGACSQDWYTHLHQGFRQFDRRLTTKLYHSTIRFFKIYDISYIFRCQRFKIQFICHVKVRTYGLWIVIYNNCLIAALFKRPCTVNRTEVEFDTLSDTDWAGTKYQHFFLRTRRIYFTFASETAVIIWCCCRKLCRTRIYHLKRSRDAIFKTHCTYFFFGHTGISCDHIVRELNSLCFRQKFRCQFFIFQTLFHLNQNGNLIDKPFVNFCNIMDFIIRCPFADQLSDNINSAVIDDTYAFQQFLFGTVGISSGVEAVQMLLQRTDRFHQSPLKVRTDTHNLSGRFHLGCQCTFRLNKFIKWQARDLDYTIIQCRLKTCIGLSGDRIWNFIQCIAECNLCCHLGDRISCRLRCQCGRTADTRVYLDNTIFK